MAKKIRKLEDAAKEDGAAEGSAKQEGEHEHNSPLLHASESFITRIRGDGNVIIQTNNVLYIYEDGAWQILEPGHYEKLDPILMDECFWSKIEFGKEYNAVWRTLKTKVMTPDVRFDDVPLIAMPEGTLDPRPEEPEVVAHDPSHYITRRIAIQYEPGAKCPEWEAMLLRMLEHPDRTPEDAVKLAKFLQQWVGINIVGPKAKANRQLQKGLIIEGVSGTGKTTFARVVTELFGSARVVSPHISDLGAEFGKAVLINAQALISDDGIETKKSADPRVLKAIVTGEQMTVNRKHKDHISFRFNGAVLFTTNTLPNFHDESDAVYGRFVLVRMDRVFTPADQRKQLKGLDPIKYLQKKGEFPGILNWALEGFAEAYDNQGFSLPAEVKEAADVFRMRNDPVFSFAKECMAPGKHVVSARALTAMCQEYAAAAHNMTKLSPKTIHTGLQKVVREVWPAVGLQNEGSVRNIIGYEDVALTELGMAYWTKTKDKQVAGLEGMSSPYGKRV
jgi:P4 family phage/plasmid primase-like protien